jgi:hypothetical protein
MMEKSCQGKMGRRRRERQL